MSFNPIQAAPYKGGFQLKFENGYTVSAATHAGAYCSPREDGASEYGAAEVAAWDADGTWVRLNEHDDVCGYMNANELAQIIGYVAGLSGLLDKVSQDVAAWEGVKS